MVPFRNFSLYIYFINLDQANRKISGKYICFVRNGIDGIESLLPIDNILAFGRLRAPGDAVTS